MVITWAGTSVTTEPHSQASLQVWKGIKQENKSQYPKSLHTLPPPCEFGLLPTKSEGTAGFSKFGQQHVATTTMTQAPRIDSSLCCGYVLPEGNRSHRQNVAFQTSGYIYVQ